MQTEAAAGAVDESIQGVPVAHWNPVRPTLDGSGSAPVDNFGDLIGPLIVRGMLRRLGISGVPASAKRLVAVGSIMHFARPDDVIWGTGINGKALRASKKLPRLDVRAVRGPHTRRLLLAQGIETPAVYGDPALLLPVAVPELRRSPSPSRPVTVIPNFNDFANFADDPRVMSPTDDLWRVLRTIADSELVVGSSLHAIVVAEALGIPARPMRSASERPFKYLDYYAGTDRHGVRFADSVEDAIGMGGVEAGKYDIGGLSATFPQDLWTADEPWAPPGTAFPAMPEWRIAAEERRAAREWQLAEPKDEQMWTLTEVVRPVVSDSEVGDQQLSAAAELVVSLLREQADAGPADRLQPGEAELLEAARGGDPAEVRRRLDRLVLGTHASVTTVEATHSHVLVEGVVGVETDDADVAIALEIMNEPSGRQIPVGRVQAERVASGRFRWTASVATSDLDAPGAWVPLLTVTHSGSPRGAIKLRFADGARVSSSPRVARRLALSEGVGGGFVAITRK